MFEEIRKNHIRGVNVILKTFKERNCEWNLLLDSDCFPYRYNWFEWLSKTYIK